MRRGETKKRRNEREPGVMEEKEGGVRREKTSVFTPVLRVHPGGG